MGRAREVKRQRQRAREGEKKADAEEPTAYVPSHTQSLSPHYQLAKFHY